MSKQREVEKQFHNRYKGYEYEKAIKQARAQDMASYGTSSNSHETPGDPEFRAQLDSCCDVICCGCCNDPHDTNPENYNSCTIL